MHNNKQYLDNCRRISSNSATQSNAPDDLSINSSSLEKDSKALTYNASTIYSNKKFSSNEFNLESASDPHDFEYSPASFVINFGEKALKISSKSCNFAAER